MQTSQEDKLLQQDWGFLHGLAFPCSSGLMPSTPLLPSMSQTHLDYTPATRLLPEKPPPLSISIIHHSFSLSLKTQVQLHHVPAWTNSYNSVTQSPHSQCIHCPQTGLDHSSCVTLHLGVYFSVSL